LRPYNEDLAKADDAIGVAEVPLAALRAEPRQGSVNSMLNPLLLLLLLLLLRASV